MCYFFDVGIICNRTVPSSSLRLWRSSKPIYIKIHKIHLISRYDPPKSSILRHFSASGMGICKLYFESFDAQHNRFAIDLKDNYCDVKLSGIASRDPSAASDPNLIESTSYYLTPPARQVQFKRGISRQLLQWVEFKRAKEPNLYRQFSCSHDREAQKLMNCDCGV